MQRRKYEVTGQRRLDGDLRRLHVSNLADENHIGVMSQDRPQSFRKGQSRLARDLYLVDAVELILDGILDGDDLSLDVIYAR